MEKIPAKGERGENTIYDHCLLEFLFLFLVFLPYIQRDVVRTRNAQHMGQAAGQARKNEREKYLIIEEP